MKSIKSLITALFVVFLAAFQVSAQEVQVFYNSSGEGFENFQKYLETEHVLQKSASSTFFPTKVLSELAYRLAQEQGYLKLVPERWQDPEKYQSLFLARNNLGSTITVDEFRTQGQGKRFWLPAMPQEGVLTTGASPKVVESKEPATESEASSSAAVLAEMERVKAEVAKISAIKHRDAKFEAQLAAIKKQMAELTDGKNTLVTMKQLEGIMKQLERATQVHATSTNERLTALEEGQSKLTARVDPLEKTVNNSVLLKWENAVLAVLGLLVIALVGSALVVWHRAVGGKKAPVQPLRAAPTVEDPPQAAEMPLAA